MNEHVVELLPLYALGGLEPDELARVEAHLPDCPDCRAQADELLQVAHMLAGSVPARVPAPHVRAALLSRLGPAREARPLVAPAGARRPPPSIRHRLGASGWAFAALMLVVAGLLGWNIYLTQQLNQLTSQVNDLGRQYRAQAAAVALISSPTTESMHLAGQGNYVTASGRAYVDPDSHNVVLVVEKLEPLDPSKSYQAWVITPEGPKNAGLVTVSRSGWGMAWLTVPYAENGKIGVSVEPAGGSQQPSQVVLLSGS